jgi:hypothetical protein
MIDNAVKQLACTAPSAVSAVVQNWTQQLHAMNDNDEPDPPPALAAPIPRTRPFVSAELQVRLAA